MTSSFRKRVTMKVISLFLYLPWMTESWLSIGQPETRKIAKQVLFSTPFELEYFDDPENPFSEEATPLASPAGTKLVLGLNKYSHDTSICAANAKTGEVLFAMSKERLTRKKHDAGNVATLVETCLECLDLDLDSIEKVVMNNHHHRILPLEKELEHMEWESGLGINGGAESGYDDEENLLSNIERVRELNIMLLIHLCLKGEMRLFVYLFLLFFYYFWQVWCYTHRCILSSSFVFTFQ